MKNEENIPSYLKELDQWVLWKLEQRGNSMKRTKVPYQPNGRKARSNDPTTWSSFQSCLRAFRNGGYDGLGFAFSKTDGLTGIDLDHCIEADGLVKAWASDVIDHFPACYTEKSPSGDGIHIWCKGRAVKTGETKWAIPGSDVQQGIEVYDFTSPRYLTVTGDVL